MERRLDAYQSQAAVDSDSNDTPDGQDEEPRETSSTRAPGASGAQRMVSFHLSQPDSGGLRGGMVESAESREQASATHFDLRTM